MTFDNVYLFVPNLIGEIFCFFSFGFADVVGAWDVNAVVINGWWLIGVWFLVWVRYSEGPPQRKAPCSCGTRRLSLWRQPRLTTSAVVSRIASQPTSFSGLRTSRAAIGNFLGENRNFNIKHRIVLYYKWNCRPHNPGECECCIMIHLSILYTNLWCASLSHKSLKNANPNPIPNPKFKP